MKRLFRYNWYVIKHRWFVMLECFSLRLFWRGLTHDLSKLSLIEQRGYISRFGDSIKTGRDKSGGYVPTDSGNREFELAWVHHHNANDHHWEYWCTPRHDGTFVVYPMSPKALVEMVCDWRGASRAQGTPKESVDVAVLNWYEENKYRMVLHSDTKLHIEEFLFPYLEPPHDEVYETDLTMEW